jgi:hypothetical protein
MSKQNAYKIATEALESKRSVPVSDLLKHTGSPQKSTLSGPDGQTYFLDVAVERLARGGGVRVTATVDLGSSFKLERVEEHIDIFDD